MKNKKKLIILIAILLLLVIVKLTNNNNEIRTIKSENELYRLYYQEEKGNLSFIEKLLTLPFSIFLEDNYYSPRGYINYGTKDYAIEESSMDTITYGTTTKKDYSETNIQVEGVDEADIIKTDGDYIYSISENKVIITNVKDPNNPNIESTIYNEDNIPVDLLLYKDKLVIISTKINTNTTGRSYYSYYDNKNTIVEVYNTKDKANTKLLKKFELEEPYYTTRCIDGKLYIFSNGYLRENNKKILINYIPKIFII